jgi:hypothetical protein
MKKNTLFALCTLSTLSYFAGAQQISSTSSASGSSNTSVAADRSGANIQSDNHADASTQTAITGPEHHQSSKEATEPKPHTKDRNNSSVASTQGLAEGTTVNAVLAKPLDSRKSKPGDPMRVSQP